MLHAAHALGLKVPQDLSVTGFDNSYVAEVMSPSLTTVHAPIRELGAAAADLLIKGPPDMDAGLVLSRPWRLEVRGSTAPPRPPPEFPLPTTTTSRRTKASR